MFLLSRLSSVLKMERFVFFILFSKRIEKGCFWIFLMSWLGCWLVLISLVSCFGCWNLFMFIWIRGDWCWLLLKKYLDKVFMFVVLLMLVGLVNKKEVMGWWGLFNLVLKILMIWVRVFIVCGWLIIWVLKWFFRVFWFSGSLFFRNNFGKFVCWMKFWIIFVLLICCFCLDWVLFRDCFRKLIVLLGKLV